MRQCRSPDSILQKRLMFSCSVISCYKLLVLCVATYVRNNFQVVKQAIKYLRRQCKC